MTGDNRGAASASCYMLAPLPPPDARIGIRIGYVISTCSELGASSSRRPTTTAPTSKL